MYKTDGHKLEEGKPFQLIYETIRKVSGLCSRKYEKSCRKFSACVESFVFSPSARNSNSGKIRGFSRIVTGNLSTLKEVLEKTKENVNVRRDLQT